MKKKKRPASQQLVRKYNRKLGRQRKPEHVQRDANEHARQRRQERIEYRLANPEPDFVRERRERRERAAAKWQARRYRRTIAKWNGEFTSPSESLDGQVTPRHMPRMGFLNAIFGGR